ncbi:MAG: bifunctional pyr operon transcriptional regulator/uracil phosphoribosyltransferase PyrR [Chromatium okenii]|jgi:pyrimidine operon attenuation protein/uracil phosphoribosyltransferase|uniref:Bifunctional pyr operon transcriptional regulator/uracil phosphoribosyltransferase PyrR n=1 Tax=Chromatium okenii TaxID=61644 RepID=A0A2S7XPY8_9GAMM|nr:bifunctional pyr operon transcriptional regulator/uracil phosphoribosyltransferase PyrR [Chromatium okenii]PQJ95736.1 bifunctional pyr operon transcriptional regulator/uracil phosphoribosyltransferase PyrR [Chromatium okenii]
MPSPLPSFWKLGFVNNPNFHAGATFSNNSLFNGEQSDIWQDAAAIDTVLYTMTADLNTLLQQRQIQNPLMIGIHTGGVWIAQRLHTQLGLTQPLGYLDISFYRDDFTRVGIHPQVRPSSLPIGIDNRHVIVVDDVLATGRTIRAALNVLFDYGRPASVLLAILAERSGRELPIAPDVVGLRSALHRDIHLKLVGPTPLQLLCVHP